MKHGAAAIISRTNQQGEKEYLLIRSNRDTGKHTGSYYPPSGWIEPGELADETVVRELWEELKLQAKPVRHLADLDGDIENLILHFWECEIVGGEMQINDKELTHAGWFTIPQMKQMTLYPTTVRLFREFLHESI